MMTIKTCLTFSALILSAVLVYAGPTAKASSVSASKSTENLLLAVKIVTTPKNITPTTLSPAEQLLLDLGVDASNFQKLQNSISGSGAPAAASAAPAPAAPKKQLSLDNPRAEMSDQEKSKAIAQRRMDEVAKEMAEIEKLNLLNSPPAPQESKSAGKAAPAAQSNSDSLPASSSSSSGSSSKNNGKIIGSAVGGCLAGVALVVGAVFAVVHAKRKRNKKSEDAIKNDVADEANFGGVDDDLE